jgi:hypothetical protein
MLRIDPTSLELLERTVDCVQRLPVLLIVTARPQFAPPWAEQPQVTVAQPASSRLKVSSDERGESATKENPWTLRRGLAAWGSASTGSSSRTMPSTWKFCHI